VTGFAESVVEDAALAWMGDLGWTVINGLDIAPDTAGSERTDYTQVILEGRLRDALARNNLNVPADAIDEEDGWVSPVPRCTRRC
jgi:type I restriction enzyme, R subunit